MARSGTECSLPVIEIIHAMEVQLCKMCGSPQLLDGQGNHWKRVRILHCDLNKLPVINTEPEPTILLFYKEKKAGEVECVIILWLSDVVFMALVSASNSGYTQVRGGVVPGMRSIAQANVLGATPLW